MEMVLPWAEIEALIATLAPHGKTTRPPFAVLTLLRIHFMQQWVSLSDQGRNWYDVPMHRVFGGLGSGLERLPDESTKLRFGKTQSPRHLLEVNNLSL